jgi:long-chain acyl-CoA synthetase
VPTGWAVRLAGDGEVLVRSDDVFDGYWNAAESTQAAFTTEADGSRWLRTGDVGRLQDDGVLQLVDRARDFIVTAGGKTLSPSFIENQLRASPYVAEAMVIGHARKYLTALIEIDFDSVADWARSHEVTYTGFTHLAAHARVQQLLGDEIARVNEVLSRVEQIKAFRILPKALDPEEEGEPVTPTRKLKRTRMLERYGTLVEAMYDDSEERRVAAGVGDALQN